MALIHSIEGSRVVGMNNEELTSHDDENNRTKCKTRLAQKWPMYCESIGQWS